MWRRRFLITLACMLGLAFNGRLWRPFFSFFFARANNDFVCTYTGAKLAGSPDLYQVEPVREIQHQLGDRPQFMMYQRFPYYAALVSPLRYFPYRTAYWIWQGVSLAAAVIFLTFWPGKPRWVTMVACCWCVALADCFVMGQDVTLLLAVLAAALGLFFRKRPFAAGCLLALCSIKLHLFVTLPLLILTRRLWRLGAGLVAGGAALAAASFAVQGWSWPIAYLRMLRLPTSTPSYPLMPNLNGLLAGQAHGSAVTALAAAVVLGAAGLVMWRGRITVAIAAMLISGLALSYHAFIADAVLLLPAGLLLVRDKASLAHRASGILLLSPLAFMGVRFENVPYRPAALVLVPLLVMAAKLITEWYSNRPGLIDVAQRGVQASS